MKKINSSRCIIFFVKAPVFGAVKTRLAMDCGAMAALDLYKAFVSDILDLISSVDASLRIFYHPEKHGSLVKDWIGGRGRLYAQKGSDLGERMHDAFIRMSAEGFEQMLLIGSDIPEIDKPIISGAFSMLKVSPAVIGPAGDGGYYLIGFRSNTLFPEAFSGIDWGTAMVMEKTLERFAQNRMDPAIVPMVRDIDTGADLLDLGGRLSNGSAGGPELGNTRAVMARMRISSKS
jgi:hypothetical protein